MGKKGFRDLVVWRESKGLAVDVYRVTGQGDIARDFGPRDQMRRAAVSVCSNIAEGDECGSDKDSVRFFNIAKGSLAELMTQVEIATEIDFLSPVAGENILGKCSAIAKMLGALIKVRKGG